MDEGKNRRNKRRQELLQAIEKLLRDNPQGLTVSEIAFYLDIDRTNIHRSLPTLAERGILLWEDKDKRYGIFDKRVIPDQGEHNYDEPIRRLRSLLNSENNEEARYQQLFQEFPWIFGTYKEILRHQKLDDENIPDFLGVRASDDLMDVFEIKPPFLKLFRADGNFSSEFNDAWNQAERYLAFAQIESDYLRRKGRLFDNPKCILIAGYNLPGAIISKLRTKHRMNPLIQFMTYDQVLSQAETIIAFIKLITQK